MKHNKAIASLLLLAITVLSGQVAEASAAHVPTSVQGSFNAVERVSSARIIMSLLLKPVERFGSGKENNESPASLAASSEDPINLVFKRLQAERAFGVSA